MIKSRHVIFWKSLFIRKQYSASRMTGTYPKYCSGFLNAADKLSKLRGYALAYMGFTNFPKSKQHD